MACAWTGLASLYLLLKMYLVVRVEVFTAVTGIWRRVVW
jgi:hypothetical protein